MDDNVVMVDEQPEDDREAVTTGEIIALVMDRSPIWAEQWVIADAVLTTLEYVDNPSVVVVR